MGAVRNLFVRIGGDASGAVKGFKEASSAGANAQKSIKKSSAQTKQSIRETFASSVPSVKEYTAQIARTRTVHQTATQNVRRLEDEISRLTGIYDTVKNATSGLDLSKPLSELMVDAEKSLTAIESRRRKLNAELRVLTSDPKTAKYKRTAALQAELNQLAEKSRYAAARMADLDRIADMVGISNIGYASAKGLERLQQEIRETENRLKTTNMVAEETGKTLRSVGVGPYLKQAIKGIGTAAAQVAGGGIKKLWSGLRGLTSASGRRIASLPGKLRNIGKSASTSTGGLTKMVRSIRNIGIASLGMRAFGLVFGELRSVITDYLNQNEELNQSIKTMKNQLGEALAPAINIVVVAMQRLMPIVTKISNSINYIFTNLFGNIKATAKAISETTDRLYGFDQITKETDTEGTSASVGTNQATDIPDWVKRLTGWLQKIKDAFIVGDWKGLGQIVGDGINSAFDALNDVDVGQKVGAFINSAMTTIHSLFETVNFSAIGTTLGKKFSEIIETVDWGLAGRTIGEVILALPKMMISFILETNWGRVAESLGECLIGALESVSIWLRETDWLKLGGCIADFITNIKYTELATKFFELLGSALSAGVSVIFGYLDGVVENIVDHFSKGIKETVNAGNESPDGLFGGVLNVLQTIFNYSPLGLTYNFVIKPFVDGIVSGFSGTTRPKAARGTIVSHATDLTVGEDGTEAVMPLEKHTEWLDVLAAKLSAKTSGGSTGGSATFQFYLGNRKITEYVVKDINQISKENGVCPIHV